MFSGSVVSGDPAVDIVGCFVVVMVSVAGMGGSVEGIGGSVEGEVGSSVVSGGCSVVSDCCSVVSSTLINLIGSSLSEE